MISSQSVQGSVWMRFPGRTDCQAHHSSTLQDECEKWYISNAKQVKLFPSMQLSCAVNCSLFSWGFDAGGGKASGSKRGQLQSCHLGSTCFRNHKWRSSLHSTHGDSIHSTHAHAALEISFVPWSHRGLKKAQWGNLIHCCSGNCQWQAESVHLL